MSFGRYLSWPKNVIHSGICWSARIARKDYHPERWVLERMCIFGQDNWVSQAKELPKLLEY